MSVIRHSRRWQACQDGNHFPQWGQGCPYWELFSPDIGGWVTEVCLGAAGLAPGLPRPKTFWFEAVAGATETCLEIPPLKQTVDEAVGLMDPWRSTGQHKTRKADMNAMANEKLTIKIMQLLDMKAVSYFLRLQSLPEGVEGPTSGIMTCLGPAPDLAAAS